MEKKVFIVEEHNEAFYVWMKAYRDGLIAPGNLLLHFDDHADFRYPVLDTSICEVMNMTGDATAHFVRAELNIDSFIVPAIYLGLINSFCWVRQDIEKTVTQSLFARTFNNEGKYFLQGIAKNGLPDEKCVPFQYIKTGAEGFSVLDNNNISAQDVLLDIDLDYFSCCENPYVQNEVVIEITEQEYNDFLQNRYHYLHFVTARVEAVQYNQSYFYVLNGVAERYPSKREVDENEIIRRIGKLVNDLAEKRIEPSLITICRSRHSGFTPRHQWQFIESNLLSALGMLYDTDVRHVHSLLENDSSTEDKPLKLLQGSAN